MPTVIEGDLMGAGKRFGIVVARFNAFITERLLQGAIDTLNRHGVSHDDITIAWVPGAFEIPIAVKKMAVSGDFDAVLAPETRFQENPAVFQTFFISPYVNER